jgi:hypothetical protein
MSVENLRHHRAWGVQIDVLSKQTWYFFVVLSLLVSISLQGDDVFVSVSIK